jgi:hypothetical protein
MSCVSSPYGKQERVDAGVNPAKGRGRPDLLNLERVRKKKGGSMITVLAAGERSQAMASRKLFSVFTLGALLVGAMSFSLFAGEDTKAEGRRGNRRGGDQARQGGGKDEGGPGGGRFDPEQMRQRMMDRYKEMLGVTDEEWKALLPKLEKVMTAQRESRSAGMGFFGPGGRGPGGERGPGGDSNVNQSALAKATSDLRTTMEDKSASAEDIGKKLTALRQAKEKARADLAAAQKDLKELLTQKQEAALVLAGMLE